MDAQFFGVAQRRRRIFLVGHFGDERAAEVLFEPEGLRWDHPTSKQKREELARAAGRSSCIGGSEGSLTPWDAQAKRIFTPDSCGPTLSSGTTEGMNIQPSVLQPVALTQDGDDISRSLTARYNSSPSIEGRGPSIVAQNQTAYVLKTRTGSDTYIKPDGKVGTAGKGALVDKECSFTLATSQDQTLIAGFKYHQGAQAGNIGYEVEQSPTLTADWHQPATLIAHTSNNEDVFPSLCATDGSKQFIDNQSVDGGRLIMQKPFRDISAHVTINDGSSWVVRRLTPTECERLQGFPDGWTDIGEWTDSKGKKRKTTDGARYKALGNSFAVPCVRWLGERLSAVEQDIRRAGDGE